MILETIIESEDSTGNGDKVSQQILEEQQDEDQDLHVMEAIKEVGLEPVLQHLLEILPK